MSSRKRQLFEELTLEIRASQSATDRFDQAVADALGLNGTDMRCLDIIDRGGRLTAGQLAQESGLTTGAVTTVIDRLEASGYACRVRDTDDRRRIYVELTEMARTNAHRYYAEHEALGEELFRRYNEQELSFLLDFVREGREFNERKAAELEARTRDHNSAA